MPGPANLIPDPHPGPLPARWRWTTRRSRVLSVPNGTASEQVVTLRPLHARHLPGHLALEVGGYLVIVVLTTMTAVLVAIGL